jgi:O-methyltransferase
MADASLTNEAMYIDLLKRVLTRLDFPEDSFRAYHPIGRKRPIISPIQRLLERKNVYLVLKVPKDPELRRMGRDVPTQAETMVGIPRLDNVQYCIEQVLEDGVPGDLIETGVWRGGTVIFMRAVLAVHGVDDRRVWVADSFQGFPLPDTDNFPEDQGQTLYEWDAISVDLETVKENFRRYGLLDDQVQFLVGWFKDTLPNAPIDSLSVLRLDADLYEPTMESLTFLEPRVSSGGFIIIDDYSWTTCARAVNDYRDKLQISSPIIPIDSTGVYWRKA